MSHLDVATLGFNGLIEREWIATNGIGGYASSSVPGMNTRKYHGLLVASMAPPVRRMVILSRVDETILCGGQWYALSSNEYPGTIHPHGHQHLRAFNAEPFPRWAFQADGWTVEKSLQLIRGENTVVLSYTLLAGNKPMDFEIRPMLALRGIHELMYQWNGRLVVGEKSGSGQVRIPATSRTPEAFFTSDGQFTFDPAWNLNTIYRREQERGYAGLEDLWSPGVLRWTLVPGQTVHFVCSTDPCELDQAIAAVNQRYRHATPLVNSPEMTVLENLKRAADAFVVNATKEADDSRRVSVISQYPWSSPSPRSSMIGFAGLLLVPGRYDEARQLLEKLSGLLKDGLVPSELPEDGGEPVYQGADVSLWFINAIHQYLKYAADESAAVKLIDSVLAIIRAYQRGTGLGIHIDADGLLLSALPSRPTSWMDARLNDWVITPRQGRPVELNALWYNALRIAVDLCESHGRAADAQELATLADRVKAAFNIRFWNEAEGCCYDTVDDHGLDPSIRPNQIFAVSLPYPVLTPDRQDRLLEVVQRDLLVSVGVRTLSPRDPAYQGHYRGDVIARDRAYHQGSAYPWLLGPLVSAFLRANGRNDRVLRQVRRWLDPVIAHMDTDGIGQIPELFDGDSPHRAGGAIASAPAVGEILRCWAEDILDLRPPARTSGAAVSEPRNHISEIPVRPR